MQQDKPIPLSDISHEIDNGIAGADVQRAQELDRLQVVRTAKQSNLQREHARLTNKLGPDHPRVLALGNKIEFNRGIMTDLSKETQRAKTVIPNVDANAWTLHGYVRDKDFKGIPNLTVGLYDQSARWIEQLGYACTDPNGYFKLKARDLEDMTDREFYLRVLSSMAEHLYVDNKPLTPVEGRLDYREVTLDEQASVCAPPTTVRRDPLPSPDAWTVRGRVTDQDGLPLPDLIITLYDKDLFFDDRLGQTETDQDGNFVLIYRTQDFRDLIERKPDIYLTVMDQEGRKLYTSKKAIRYESGRIEILNIKINY